MKTKIDKSMQYWLQAEMFVISMGQKHSFNCGYSGMVIKEQAALY
jgi:hypothetical protein